MTSYLKAMRPERWPRSLAILAGSAALLFLNPDPLTGWAAGALVLRLGAAFLLTWAISTANYIVNEVVDAPYDRHHPTKKDRPLLRGEIRKAPFLAMGAVLTLSSLGMAAAFFSGPFFLSLAGLLVAGFVYNIPPVRTKDIPFLDAISESANNPIRFFIGWYALAPDGRFPPLSLLFCWWAFGNFLLVAKRLSEYRYLKDKAGDYRASLKRYSRNSLILGMALSALVFFLTFVLFSLTSGPRLYLALIPFLLVFLYLIFLKTLKEEEVMEEPERLLKHLPFALYTLFLLILFVAASLAAR